MLHFIHCRSVFEFVWQYRLMTPCLLEHLLQFHIFIFLHFVGACIILPLCAIFISCIFESLHAILPCTSSHSLIFSCIFYFMTLVVLVYILYILALPLRVLTGSFSPCFSFASLRITTMKQWRRLKRLFAAPLSL